MKKYSAPVLRIAMAAVFLWFGFSQTFDTSSWTYLIPAWITDLGVSPETVVLTNGIAEIVLGLMLLFGVYVRVVALLLALHLFGITFNVGYNPTGVRDFGLSVATLAVFLNGSDFMCLMQGGSPKSS